MHLCSVYSTVLVCQVVLERSPCVFRVFLHLQAMEYAKQLYWTMKVFKNSNSPLLLASTEYPDWANSVTLAQLHAAVYALVVVVGDLLLHIRCWRDLH